MVLVEQKKWILKLARSSRKKWYLPLLAGLAAIDLYILIVPLEAVLVTSVLLNRKRWISIALWMVLGSAVGALSLAFLSHHYGPHFVEAVSPGLLNSETWIKTVHFLDDWGIWAMALIAASFLPQQPAVIVAGLSRMSLGMIVLSVVIGRAGKYLVFAFAASQGSKWVRKYSKA